MITVNPLMRPDILGGAKAFVFDCDGVLIDSYEANTVYYNLFKKEFELPLMTQEETDFVHMHTVFESIRHIVPEERHGEALRFKEQLDYRLVVPSIRREPGILELLSSLRGKGFPLAVNTSRTDTLCMVFTELGFDGYFHPIVTSTTTGKAKPDPEGMYLILRTLGLSKEEIVFIGDSRVDQMTAENSGVRFWAYKNPMLVGEALIPDFDTLRVMLDRAYPNGRD